MNCALSVFVLFPFTVGTMHRAPTSDSWLLAPEFYLFLSSLYTRYYFISITILLQNKKIKRINPILIFILSYLFLYFSFSLRNTRYSIRILSL